MDWTDTVFAADDFEIETFSAAEAEAGTARDVLPFAPVLAAYRKRAAAHGLDAALRDLVTHRAEDFASLSPREQAAVTWVEAVISHGKTQGADGAYAALQRYFDDAAIAKLTALAGTASARAKLGALRRG